MRPWIVPSLLLLGARPLADPLPPTLGMWYWHTPFRLSAADRARLGHMGVRTLYVRAGTFSSDGRRAVVVQSQRWETATDLETVVTMNFDPGLVSHLEAIPLDRLANDVARGLLAARRACRGRSAGFQLDVDCPTRLLPRYTDLLRRVRRQAPGPFSITALPTWLASPDVGELAGAVDFIVPQFYENRTPRTLAGLAPVSDPVALRRGLARLRHLGVPFRAGLAAYGHALLYDPAGRLAGMYRGLSPEDALRHPALRPESSGALEGERKLVLRAVAPDAHGRGQGAWIAYVLPTAEALRRQLAGYRESAPPNALGPILYRFPEAGEAMTLPLATMEAALEGGVAKPSLRVTLSAHAAPWAAIAGGAPTHVLRAKAVAVGDGPSEFRPGAVQLLIRLGSPGVEAVAPGDFDEVQVGTLGPDGRFRRGAGARADAVLFRRGGVLPGETLRTGDVETRRAGRARVEWSVVGADGDGRGVVESPEP